MSTEGEFMWELERQRGQTEGWVAVIPEPSTAALLALGLVVLGLRRRGA